MLETVIKPQNGIAAKMLQAVMTGARGLGS
jgi:hypothetical protein